MHNSALVVGIVNKKGKQRGLYKKKNNLESWARSKVPIPSLIRTYSFLGVLPGFTGTLVMSSTFLRIMLTAALASSALGFFFLWFRTVWVAELRI
jgi:hypothetical protein